MEKYLLCAGILWTALGLGGGAPGGHLYGFHAGRGARAEIRTAQEALQEARVYKRLGPGKYLLEEGGRVVMLDTEQRAGERILCRELVERIEQEATDCLRKRAGEGAEKEKVKES